jgi:hypothetical protein
MAAIIVLVIVGICVAYQYLRGTFVKSVATIFTVISASIVAFGFFELLAQMLISKANTSSALLPYAHTLIFVLLFVIAIAIFQAVITFLAPKTVTVGPLPDKIGRCVCGAISGAILAGLLITVLAMVPIKDNIPYERFSSSNPNPSNPQKAPLNADGIPAGIFGIVSRGSFAGSTSFAVVHPSFNDEIFLNKLNTGKNVNLVNSTNVIDAPAKAGAWLAPANLKNQDGQPVDAETGYNLVVVRVGINKKAGAFNLSQLRLMCNDKTSEQPLKGSAVNAYPIGYFTQPDQIQIKNLSEKIDIPDGAYQSGKKKIDFVFNVPSTHVPVLVALRNSIASVSKLVNTEDAPEPELLSDNVGS